jgi:hypothetical protein
MFERIGETTPPTQLATRRHFALRVGAGVAVAAVVGRVVPGWDGVPDGDLVGADEDVLDEQSQDSLALGDGCASPHTPERDRCFLAGYCPPCSFRIRVSHRTQEHSSKFLPTASGMQRSASWRTRHHPRARTRRLSCADEVLGTRRRRNRPWPTCPAATSRSTTSAFAASKPRPRCTPTWRSTTHRKCAKQAADRGGHVGRNAAATVFLGYPRT